MKVTTRVLLAGATAAILIPLGGDLYKGGDSDSVDGLSKQICPTKT